MFSDLLTYDMGPGIDAFSSRRNSELPYPVIQGHQVHGCEVAVIDRPGMTREELEGFDAFVTCLPEVAIGVRTADCVPVLLYDPVRRVVAAVHSGWKGTVSRISQRTIDLMERQFRCSAGHMHAIIGPAIGPDSFQVGQEVACEFAAAGFPMQLILKDCGPKSPTPDDPMQGGLHIDLWQANRWLLEQAGVRPDSIQVTGICTYRNNDRFFSARREGTKCGRIINVIKLI